MSIDDAYNIIAPAVKAGSNVVLLLPEDPRGLEASRKIARWLVRVGFTSTEFDRKVLESGESITLPIANLNLLFRDADNSTDRFEVTLVQATVV